MPGFGLELLGNRIRNARRLCGLTQQELANQTGLSVKTIHDIENGRNNPTYETLMRLMSRLGVSPDTIFFSKTLLPSEEMRQFLENFQSCAQREQEILFKTLYFLAEQLRTNQEETD